MSIPGHVSIAASLLAGALAIPGTGDQEPGHSWVDSTLEDLGRLRSDRSRPLTAEDVVALTAEDVGALTGVVIPDANPGDPCMLELVQIDGDAPELPVWKGEIQGVDQDWWYGLHSIRPLPKLTVGRGTYRLRADGLPCVLARSVPPGERLLFPLQPARSADLTVAEISSGCLSTLTLCNRFHGVRDGYVNDEGCSLSQDDVATLRNRVLASKPVPAATLWKILEKPDDYLASLGITDEVIAAHVPAIRAACVSPGWKHPDGSMPSIPAEFDALFTPGQLKLRLAAYLLRVSSGSTQRLGVLVEIPGDPWIQLGTGSAAPEFVPWFVVAGADRWYTLDRELSRAIADLAPFAGWMRSRLAHERDWRKSVWSDANAWGDIPTEVDKMLSRRQFESIRGWSEMEKRAVPAKWSPQPRPEQYLPMMEMRPTTPGTIDGLIVRPGTSPERDWTDVASEYDLAERAANAQPWLHRWKAANSGRLSVFLPCGHEDLASRRATAERAWKEARLPGSPQFFLSFDIFVSPDSTVPLSCGLGVLSVDGTLLILGSMSARGPLASKVPITSDPDARRFGVVRPGRELEMHRLP